VDGATLDIETVMRMLPHRYPFLMVDRVTRIAGNHITALKNVTFNEPFFQGHFPGHPSCRACSSSRPSPRSPASS